MMFSSATVSAATVYGCKDPKSLAGVYEHWTNNGECNWHNGPYSYLTRSELEKEGSMKEVHFRYNKLGDVVILRLVKSQQGLDDGWYADTGSTKIEFVCKLTCDQCHHIVNPDMEAKHDQVHHTPAISKLLHRDAQEELVEYENDLDSDD